MTIYLHQNDLPQEVKFCTTVAVDTESMGLNPKRDRLCLVQLSAGDGNCHLIQINKETRSPHLKAVLTDPHIQKIFHFARADMGFCYIHLNVCIKPVYCTKIVSRLVRTYTQEHSLKNLLKHMLDIEVSKEHQTSDWGVQTLSEEQKKYAANDVLYLHRLKEKLDALLKREKRETLAQQCFDFLSTRVELDALGYKTTEPFDY